MKTIAMSLTSATALLCGSAMANFDNYIISSNQPIASISSVADSVQSQFARLQAIENANLEAIADLSDVGAFVEKQLNNLGAISFAKLSKEQVALLTQMGYKVESQNMFHLVDADQPFPEITIENEFDPLADNIPYGIEKVRADEAWSTSRGAGAKVCIIDTGLDLDHPDLEPNYVTGVRTTGGSSPNDQNGHGTHVAGTIAATDDGNGVVGVAPDASLYIAAVFGAQGSTTEQAILEGLDWCVGQNVDTMNMSYGGSGSSSASERAYQEAYDAGILMVAATGNSGASTPIGYPAAYDTTMAVGATDSNDRIASFSQRGPQIDVVAPGVSVVSSRNGGGTTSLSGTSMATPHVTGASASIIAADGSLTHDQVRQLLRDTADDLGSSGFDNTYGYGRIDVMAALDELGSGGGNSRPIAKFSYVADLLNVTFTDESSDSDGEIISWSWDFGDGNGSSEASPSHSYATKGTYNVSLTVTDDGGASRTKAQSIEVSDGTTPDIDISLSAGSFWIFKYVAVSWEGATGTNVDIYKNGNLYDTTANDGSYVDFTAGTNTFQVCEEGSTTECSDEATISN